MELTQDEKEGPDEFTAYPFYRDMIENAPNGACRDCIIHGLICGMQFDVSAT